MREFDDSNYWTVILGGSSGLGLATAKKLAKHGMNICIIHRNPRMQEGLINAEFEIIKQKGFNLNRLIQMLSILKKEVF